MVEGAIERVAAASRAVGARGPTRWYSAPGRVNLMGDHTDHEEGFVLPAAIDRACVVVARPLDERVRVRSLDLPGHVDLPSSGAEEPTAVEPAWGRSVAGVIRELRDAGREPIGADIVLASDVPLGAGLSSSAALEVAVALALCDAAGFEMERSALALACQRAEFVATGVPCGVMDPMISLAGVEGAAILIDCRSLSTRAVPIPDALAILVVHSGVSRVLADGNYGERRAAFAAASDRLGVSALRDATPADAADDPVARHVVSENARVLATVEALMSDDRPAIGRLFAQSQASLSEDARVSTPELDVLTRALVDAGCVGARMTGAGFGGCAVALCERDRLQPVADRALAIYRARTGLSAWAFACRPSVGGGRMEAPRPNSSLE